MTISIIVAVSKNGVIGKDNQLLWRLPDDLKRFKNLTMNHPIIMGRKTFESIGKPLPGRTSIVVTRNPDFTYEGVIVAHSLEEALQKAAGLHAKETFIIGGGELYKLAQSLSDKLYITEVEITIEGDTYFEILKPSEWTEISRIVHEADERHIFPFAFADYVRRNEL